MNQGALGNMEVKLQTPVQAQLTRLTSSVEISERSRAVHEKLTKNIKNELLNSAKRISVDLSRLSNENRLLTENTAPSKKVTAASSALININFNNVANDAIFRIDGVQFSKNEVESAQKVMRNAISFLQTAGSNLDYKDYASMGIAISSVSTWADGNLSEEQSSVLKKAIKDYTDYMSASERENQQRMGVSIDDNKNYGATISNGETDKMINHLKEHLSKVTGKNYAHSYGNVVIQQSATNRKLTSDLKDLFVNIDLTDADSVQQTYQKFMEMVTPAYNSYGITNQQNGLNNVLRQNINNFAAQISASNAFLAKIGNNAVDITA